MKIDWPVSHKCDTLRYFQGILRYFKALWGTSRHFEVLLGTRSCCVKIDGAVTKVVPTTTNWLTDLTLCSHWEWRGKSFCANQIATERKIKLYVVLTNIFCHRSSSHSATSHSKDMYFKKKTHDSQVSSDRLLRWVCLQIERKQLLSGQPSKDVFYGSCTKT